MTDSNIHVGHVHSRPRDIVWAVFLIFIGVVFLLNTTGLVGWGIWIYILRFWPIFIILLGLRLIIGRSFIGEIVLSIISVILFIVIGGLSFLAVSQKQYSFVPDVVNRCVSGECKWAFFNSGDLKNEQFVVKEQDFPSVESRVVDLNIGATDFTVKDDSITGYMSVDAQYDEGYLNPSLKSTEADGVLNTTFSTTSKSVNFWNFGSNSHFDFIIGRPSLKTEFDLDLGAGDGDISFTNLNLTNMSTSVGAGDLTLTFGENAIPSELLKVEVGAGDTTINLPANVGYEITYSLGIGNISVNGEDIATFAGNEENVKSANYDSAAKIVKINANVGVGSLDINIK